ncbi:MAG: hypothetical protein ACTSSJ_07295 [Candidatus Odinarchaeia archaeon]
MSVGVRILAVTVDHPDKVLAKFGRVAEYPIGLIITTADSERRLEYAKKEIEEFLRKRGFLF